MNRRFQANLLLLFALLLPVLSGCSTAAYYFQAVEGHLAVMRRAVPFEEAMAADNPDSVLSRQLQRAREIREFASRELGLPDNGSYRRYADIGRPYVLWNVFAAPEFSASPAESCFPFAGCVAYRGFFSEADARAHAQRLAADGLDTHIGGVPAYSTLGWFDDPVLSTFIHYPEVELTRIIIHELAHQVMYVRDDTRFNESFAVAVEREGVERWLARLPADRAAEERRRWADSQSRRSGFLALLMRHRATLADLYASDASEIEKRRGKALQFDALRREYQSLKQSWGGFPGYDRFFAQQINNALLASIAVYTDFVPAFAAMIETHRGNNGEMGAFYAEVKRLAGLSRDKRIEAMRELMPRGVP